MLIAAVVFIGVIRFTLHLPSMTIGAHDFPGRLLLDCAIFDFKLDIDIYISNLHQVEITLFSVIVKLRRTHLYRASNGPLIQV
jgi:hypothetical protein